MNHTCEVCGKTGGQGAKWLVFVKGDKNPPRRVHRPCGISVMDHLPEGIDAELKPSQELRAEWKAKREEQRAKDFWNSKFAEAETRKKGTDPKKSDSVAEPVSS